MNDTEYLNQSENNKERLQQSIKESEKPILTIDVENAEASLNHLDSQELEYIIKVCEMLQAKTWLY